MSGEVSRELEKKEKSYLSDCTVTRTHNHWVRRRTLKRVCDMIKTNTTFMFSKFNAQIESPFNRSSYYKSKTIHDKILKLFKSVEILRSKLI